MNKVSRIFTGLHKCSCLQCGLIIPTIVCTRTKCFFANMKRINLLREICTTLFAVSFKARLHIGLINATAITLFDTRSNKCRNRWFHPIKLRVFLDHFRMNGLSVPKEGLWYLDTSSDHLTVCSRFCRNR